MNILDIYKVIKVPITSLVIFLGVLGRIFINQFSSFGTLVYHPYITHHMKHKLEGRRLHLYLRNIYKNINIFKYKLYEKGGGDNRTPATPYQLSIEVQPPSLSILIRRQQILRLIVV